MEKQISLPSLCLISDFKSTVGRAIPEEQETVTKIPQRVPHHKPAFMVGRVYYAPVEVEGSLFVDAPI